MTPRPQVRPHASGPRPCSAQTSFPRPRGRAPEGQVGRGLFIGSNRQFSDVGSREPRHGHTHELRGLHRVSPETQAGAPSARSALPCWTSGHPQGLGGMGHHGPGPGGTAGHPYCPHRPLHADRTQQDPTAAGTPGIHHAPVGSAAQVAVRPKRPQAHGPQQPSSLDVGGTADARHPEEGTAPEHPRRAELTEIGAWRAASPDGESGHRDPCLRVDTRRPACSRSS